MMTVGFYYINVLPSVKIRRGCIVMYYNVWYEGGVIEDQNVYHCDCCMIQPRVSPLSVSVQRYGQNIFL